MMMNSSLALLSFICHDIIIGGNLQLLEIEKKKKKYKRDLDVMIRD